MRRMLLILLSLLTLTTGAARADDAALGRRGETVYPLSQQSVRMVSEEVRLKISVQRIEVDLTFTFVNEGPAQEVLMGFPVGFAVDDERMGDPELYDFRTWVDGQEVAVRREKGATPPVQSPDGMGWQVNYAEWITWTVPFAEGQSRTIRNSYWGNNYHNSVGYVATGYILQTGATWKEQIGEAVIIAQFDGILPGQITAAYPTSYRWEEDRMVWQMHDFEPDRDVQIWFQTRPEGGFPPGELFNPIMQAESVGGAEGLRILREARQVQPNTSAEPDALDLALAKFEYLYGDKDAGREIARQALEAGSAHSTAIYIAGREGLEEVASLLSRPDLTSGIRRYLRDLGGFEGEPPTQPTLWLRMTGFADLRLSDPDGDLDQWGITIWGEPDETAEPLFTTRGFPDTSDQQQAYAFGLSGEWLERDQIWYTAWAVDGRGHRVERPLTQVTLRESAGPEQPGSVQEQDLQAGSRVVWLLTSLAALLLLNAIYRVAVRRAAGWRR